MNRIEYIKTLSSKMSYVMRPEDVKELVDYYDEMILDLMEEGLSEEEAVSRLDSPDKIVETVKGTPLELNLPVNRAFNPLLIFLLIVGFPLWGSLALAGIAILLSVYLVIWCIPFIIGVLAFSGVVGGLVSAALSPLALLDGLHVGLTQMGIGMLLFGAGILLTILTTSISKTFINYSQETTKAIKQVIFTKRSVTRI